MKISLRSAVPGFWDRDPLAIEPWTHVGRIARAHRARKPQQAAPGRLGRQAVVALSVTEAAAVPQSLSRFGSSPLCTRFFLRGQDFLGPEPPAYPG